MNILYAVYALIMQAGLVLLLIIGLLVAIWLLVRDA
jgi:hypothetical protein